MWICIAHRREHASNALPTVAHKWQPSPKLARTTPTPHQHHNRLKLVWCGCGVVVVSVWRELVWVKVVTCGPPYLPLPVRRRWSPLPCPAARHHPIGLLQYQWYGLVYHATCLFIPTAFAGYLHCLPTEGWLRLSRPGCLVLPLYRQIVSSCGFWWWSGNLWLRSRDYEFASPMQCSSPLLSTQCDRRELWMTLHARDFVYSSWSFLSPTTKWRILTYV